MTDPYPFEMNVQELHALRQSSDQSAEQLTLLDIRENHEVETCAIDGSLHIPMNDIPDNMDKLPREGMLVVYCHVGGRSAQVTAWLRGNNVDNAINLIGGIKAWTEEIDTDMNDY